MSSIHYSTAIRLLVNKQEGAQDVQTCAPMTVRAKQRTDSGQMTMPESEDVSMLTIFANERGVPLGKRMRFLELRSVWSALNVEHPGGTNGGLGGAIMQSRRFLQDSVYGRKGSLDCGCKRHRHGGGNFIHPARWRDARGLRPVRFRFPILQVELFQVILMAAFWTLSAPRRFHHLRSKLELMLTFWIRTGRLQ